MRQLSNEEEIALRRIANGAPIVDAEAKSKLLALALLEFTSRGLRLTPLGKHCYDSLPKAPLLTRRVSLHLVSDYVEAVLEKAKGSNQAIVSSRSADPITRLPTTNRFEEGPRITVAKPVNERRRTNVAQEPDILAAEFAAYTRELHAACAETRLASRAIRENSRALRQDRSAINLIEGARSQLGRSWDLLVKTERPARQSL